MHPIYEKKNLKLFFCPSIKMNPRVKGICKKALISKAKKLGIKEPHTLSTKTLLNIVSRHVISKKVTRLLKEKIGERANITRSNLEKALEFYTLSLNDMKKFVKLRGIKNWADLTKEDLFYTLLRSEKSPREDLYLKYMNNATNSDIKERINHIRMLMAKVGNTITGKERKAIREELFKLRNTKFTKTTRKRAAK